MVTNNKLQYIKSQLFKTAHFYFGTRNSVFETKKVFFRSIFPERVLGMRFQLLRKQWPGRWLQY